MPKSNFRVDFSYEMCFYFGVIKWLGIFFLSLFVVVGVGVAAEMRLIYWARFSCWLYVLLPIQCHWRVCNHISQYWSYESRSDTAEWVKSFRWKALNMVLIELFATEMYSCVCVLVHQKAIETHRKTWWVWVNWTMVAAIPISFVIDVENACGQVKSNTARKSGVRKFGQGNAYREVPAKCMNEKWVKGRRGKGTE